MFTRFKSFCLGIIVTSLTWAVAIYLFSRLNEAGRREKFANSFSPNGFSEDFGSHFSESRLGPRPKGLQSKDLKVDDPVKLPQSNLTRIFTHEEQNKKIEGFKRYAFNGLVSDRIGFSRNVPDVRNTLCQDILYRPFLPQASIIICFYNEAFSALMRTIYSVLSRTPMVFIKEIILIDDYSDIDDLGKEVSKFVAKNLSEKVKYFKTEKREGLIRARLYGASLAIGEVLVFLDSHCEVNVKWLEPLLDRIADNRTIVAIPIIDMISPDDFSYSASPMVRGGFNWGLHFKWDNLAKDTLKTKADFVKPIKTPTMAGGLFAVDRDYFLKVGSYDKGMDVWGGENIEMSFRIWMCGGRLEIIPCSRVGHIFRSRRPYGNTNKDNFYLRNSLRVALVWMDDYIDKFFEVYKAAKSLNPGDISDRVQLKKQLNCHSFKWYLDEVYPEILQKERKEKNTAASSVQLINLKRNRQFLRDFIIRLTGTNLCLQSQRPVLSKGSLLVLDKCNDLVKNQVWSLTNYGEIMLSKRLCLETNTKGVMLGKCHFNKGSQEWSIKSQMNGTIYNMPAGLCLGIDKGQRGHIVSMEICSKKGNIHWDQVIV